MTAFRRAAARKWSAKHVRLVGVEATSIHALARKWTTKRAQPERALHRDVAEYLNAVLTPDTFWTSIPGGDGKVTRTPGYTAGTPDILIVWHGFAYWIELKAEREYLKPVQKHTGTRIIDAGCPSPATCRSIADVQETLAEWRIPTRVVLS